VTSEIISLDCRFPFLLKGLSSLTFKHGHGSFRSLSSVAQTIVPFHEAVLTLTRAWYLLDAEQTLPTETELRTFYQVFYVLQLIF